MPKMRLDDMLFSQGFGTRRVCAGLVEHGHVRLIDADGARDCEDADEPVDTSDGLAFEVMGERWAFHSRAYLALNKPLGVECSQKPSAWPSVYTLLPAPLRQRPASNKTLGVQGIGRLDQDTTGLLLLSDDGALIHRMASPKHHVPKIYQVTCEREVTAKQLEQLLQGVVLRDDNETVRATQATATGSHNLELTLTQGKYHQVRRMLAAVGNHVNALHRSQIGGFKLPEDLPLGQWRWLTALELAQARCATLPEAH
jgi:16S rRNA pseudouridine516 synthase